MKVNVDSKALKYLAEQAIRNGKEKAWIELALDWIEQAEVRIAELKNTIELYPKSNEKAN